MNWVLIFSAVMLSLVCAGCTADDGVKMLPTIQMQIGKQKFTLEVADTDATREKGLMNRDSMPADHGMLFVFEEERQLSFWMKNTRIPLDILYLDAQARIVSIYQLKPFDINSTPSAKPAQYAIELNLGAANKAEVKVGDKLDIPALPNRRAATTRSR